MAGNVNAQSVFINDQYSASIAGEFCVCFSRSSSNIKCKCFVRNFDSSFDDGSCGLRHWLAVAINTIATVECNAIGDGHSIGEWSLVGWISCGTWRRAGQLLIRLHYNEVGHTQYHVFGVHPSIGKAHSVRQIRFHFFIFEFIPIFSRLNTIRSAIYYCDLVRARCIWWFHGS